MTVDGLKDLAAALGQAAATVIDQRQMQNQPMYQHTPYSQYLPTMSGTNTTTPLPYNVPPLAPWPTTPPMPYPPPFSLSAEELDEMTKEGFDMIIASSFVGARGCEARCKQCSSIIIWAEGGWRKHRANCVPLLPATDVDGI